ncbi:lysophospholipid acyltransferase LPEAT1-like isoform X2 [Salvia splendens]|uniref:lysophospholipid acyltransferase LPEAT1-like isoform X2 n=1 Tax=Salvia splendens TaxID=180675 RepID=UPI001C266BF1|nr:lysophospholipid acyltransferase LPEAT1-like isoform X2 [Salvia splendens]
MESELKVLTRQSTSQRPELERDDRPLLKPDSAPDAPQKPVPEPGQSIEEMESKYAAYVRRDVYGTMGRGRLSWAERLWLVPRLVILVPIRVVAGMTILVSYYVICRVCTVFRAPNREDGEEQEDYAHLRGWRRAVILRTGRFLSRAALFVFGFYWISETRGENENESSDHSEGFERYGAIISNHVSYIDILYHMSSSFPSFVAKRSVSKLPLVGLISKCLGCVFVQRELKSSDFKGVSGVVTDRIREAYQDEFAPRMIIFPEGTTTNGDYLLPFKTGAFLAKAPVQPVILRYPYRRFSPAWDSISGARHVILLLSQFVNYIEVKRLPVYHPSEQEMEDPKLYAANVRKLMAQEGNLILSDIGLPEKRVYHAALNGLLPQT